MIMLVWVASRVMLARQELGQGQAHHTKNEMVAMLDVSKTVILILFSCKTKIIFPFMVFIIPIVFIQIECLPCK